MLLSAREIEQPLPYGRTILLAIEDVTEQRQAQEAQEQRLASIVESSDDAIISKDMNGIIQTWNRGAERIFGYTAAEAVATIYPCSQPPATRTSYRISSNVSLAASALIVPNQPTREGAAGFCPFP